MALLRRLLFGLGLSRPRAVPAWALSAMLLAGGTALRADAPLPAASQLKAVFLFNFAQFLAWPAGAFQDPHAPIVIGILGDDPLGSYLEGLVKGEKIGDRPLIVRHCQSTAEAASCHILFIGHSEAGTLDTLLGQLKGKSVLTVGEEESFSKHGGMVAFTTQSNGKIGLRINNAAAKDAGLTISSRLLAHATLVPEAKN